MLYMYAIHSHSNNQVKVEVRWNKHTGSLRKKCNNVIYLGNCSACGWTKNCIQTCGSSCSSCTTARLWPLCILLSFTNELYAMVLLQRPPGLSTVVKDPTWSYSNLYMAMHRCYQWAQQLSFNSNRTCSFMSLIMKVNKLVLKSTIAPKPQYPYLATCSPFPMWGPRFTTDSH